MELIFAAFWFGFFLGLLYADPPRVEEPEETLAVQEAERIVGR